MEAIMNYIKPELVILIPVLYIIGMAMKHTSALRDEIIPVTLGLAGIALTLLWLLGNAPASTAQEWAMFVFTGVVQGILVAGAAVYFNQIGKQAGKAHQKEVILDGEAHQS